MEPIRSGWAVTVAARAADRPLRVLVLWAILVTTACVGVSQLRIDATIGSALNRTDESWVVYERSIERHGGDEFIAVIVEGREPFDREALRSVIELSDRFEAVEGVRRVDSLSTVPLIRAGENEELLLDAALDDQVLESAAGVDRFSRFLEEDRIAPRSLISEDETTFGVNLLFDGDVDADREAPVAAVRNILRGHEARISGVPVVRADAGVRTRVEIAIFVPLTVAAVSLILWLLFRSTRAIAVSLIISSSGTLLCLGAMGASGVAVSISTLLIPSVVLALGCAYSMHLLVAAQGVSGSRGLAEAAGSVAEPILLSGVTTGLGFLAMATVRIELIRDLATFGALGAVFVSAATVTLGPAILRFLPLQAPRSRIDRWIRASGASAVLGLVSRRPQLIILSWVTVGVVMVAGLGKLQVASDVIRWFPPQSELRQDYEVIRERLSGITPVNVLVESVGGELVTRPDVVARIAELASSLEALPKVGKALSVADPLQQIHEVFSGATGLPDRHDLIGQYLLMLGSMEQLDDVLTPDRLSANILLRVNNNSSSEIVEISEWVRAWWDESGVPGFSATTTGIMFEFGQSQDEIAYGGLRGFSLALAAIGIVLLVVFRDAKVALSALVPNAVPLVIVFGFMGLAGIPVDAATVCLGSLALGIAVDDTIHVVSGFRLGESRGASARDAIESCLRAVLPALVFTTVTVAAGFGLLGISEFTLVRNLGLLTAGAAILCLLADVLLLPALLLGRSRPDGR